MKSIHWHVGALAAVAALIAVPALVRAESQVSDPGAFGILVDPNASGTKVSGFVTLSYDYEVDTPRAINCTSGRWVRNLFGASAMQKGNTVQAFNSNYALAGVNVLNVNITGTFARNAQITGATSGATALVYAVQRFFVDPKPGPDYLMITDAQGTFQSGEAIMVGTAAQGVVLAPATDLEDCFDRQDKQVLFLRFVIERVIVPGFFACAPQACPSFAVKSIKNFLTSGQGAGTMEVDLAVK